jgi:hypothetical protein
MTTTHTEYDLLGERWPLIVTAVFAVLAASIYPYALRALQIARIPTIGIELGGLDKRRHAYIVSARALYIDGYRKVRKLYGICEDTLRHNIYSSRMEYFGSQLRAVGASHVLNS